MITDSSDPVEGALRALRARVLREPGLSAELGRARCEFFASGTPAPGEDERAAERRLDEWFLLERPNEALQGVPVEALAHALAGEGELPPESIAALRGSFCGVFEVTSVALGEGAWIRDLLGGGEYPLADGTGSGALEEGDVLIGRLFSLGELGHWLSRSAAFFRSPALLAALQRDLEAARKSRRGVPRLSQQELESMFWQHLGAAASATGKGVERAREVLDAGGIAAGEIEEILAELARAPLDRKRLLHGVGDALGVVLDRLAFQTGVDLEEARTVLLAAWQELAPPSAVEPSAQPQVRGGTDVREALASFERGRQEGRDLEVLFRQLERDLGLESEADDADDEGAGALEFPGAVGALVDEFLWEIEREHGESAAQRYAVLRRLSQYAASLSMLEELTPRELLAFTAVWLPERGELRDAEDARSTLEALAEFARWAEETQGVPLRTDFGDELDRLGDSLPRIARVNALVAEPDVSGEELFEVAAVDAEGQARVRGRNGDERRIPLARELAGELRSGDRLRGSIDPAGTLRIARVYPPESAAILGTAS